MSSDKNSVLVLHIDTSKKDELKVVIGDVVMTSSPTGEHRSQMLLQIIEQALKKGKISLSNIGSISVNAEGESFTGLRIGIAVANALAYVLRIPVNGNSVGKYVEPLYQGHYGGES